MAAHVQECASRCRLSVQEEKTTSWIRLLLREHPALVLSGLYISASVVGMFYSWAFLRRFGINVFNYAAISDFLLASLKEPLTWGLVIIAVGLVVWDNSTSRRYEKKGKLKWLRWYGTPRYRFFNNFVAVYIVLSFLYLYADFRADRTWEGEGKVVAVAFEESGDAINALLLGTTGQFVFLYDAESTKVGIHPIENIHSISFLASQERDDNGDQAVD